MHVNQPIDKNRPHLLVDVRLQTHIMRIYECLLLLLKKSREDFGSVLTYILGIHFVLAIAVEHFNLHLLSCLSFPHWFITGETDKISTRPTFTFIHHTIPLSTGCSFSRFESSSYFLGFGEGIRLIYLHVISHLWRMVTGEWRHVLKFFSKVSQALRWRIMSMVRVGRSHRRLVEEVFVIKGLRGILNRET